MNEKICPIILHGVMTNGEIGLSRIFANIELNMKKKKSDIQPLHCLKESCALWVEIISPDDVSENRDGYCGLISGRY